MACQRIFLYDILLLCLAQLVSFLPSYLCDVFFTCNSFLFFSQADASACWLFESKISVTFDDIFSHTVSYSREKHLPLYIDLYCFFLLFISVAVVLSCTMRREGCFSYNSLFTVPKKVAHSDDQQDRRTQ